MIANKQLTVKNINVNFFSQNEKDYISLIDIVQYKNAKEPKDIVKNWMRNRNTIEFLELWE